MMMTPVSLTEARDLARDLGINRIHFAPVTIAAWPRWKFRAARMWLGLEHRSTIAFATWITRRAALPHCRVCGCSDDDLCDGGCGWAELDLCTVCADAH